MAWTGSGVVTDLATGLPVLSRPRVQARRLDTGAVVDTQVANASGVVTFTALPDGVSCVGVANIGAGIHLPVVLSGLPTGLVTSAMILDGTIVNADISGTADIIQSKIYVPRALFHLTASQSIANGVELAIAFGAGGQVANVGGFWVASAPTRFTVPAGEGGYYAMTGQIVFAASAAGTRRVAELFLNGASYLNYYSDWPSRGGTLDTIVPIERRAVLVAGDYLELRAFQDSGGALNVIATTNGTFFAMERLA